MEILSRTRPIGIIINKHSHTVPMNLDQPVEQYTSVLEGIESRNTDYTPPSPIFVEEFLPIVQKEEEKPILKQRTRKGSQPK